MAGYSTINEFFIDINIYTWSYCHIIMYNEVGPKLTKEEKLKEEQILENYYLEFLGSY